MRILSIHNRYKIRGGEDESRELEERLMRDRGHTVDVYEEDNDQLNSMGAAKIAVKTIWSEESFNIVRQRLQQAQYDIVHVQNFFPLISPSVYYAAQSEGVPVVQTLRNYRLLCPNALFFRNGQVCQDCIGKIVPYPGIVHSCYRQNTIASAGVATMISFHRAMRTWTSKVDIYIALTEFARQKFIEGGLPADQIFVKPNFVHPDPGVGVGVGGYALYVGRLSVEKGLDTLLTAWEHLHLQIPLKIVGDGPLAPLVERATQRLSNVEWLGRRPMSEVHTLMGNAKFVIFPSKWYETFGRVAVESFAKGTPVIASDIGAISELIDHQKTGLYFKPGDSEDLAEKVRWLLSQPDVITRMRKACRLEFEKKYTEAANYQRMLEIYQLAQSRTPSLAKRA